MRLAVLGDIHSNYEALESVLTDIRRRGVDEIVHVGDVVGYCTDFELCIERLQVEGIRGIHGNHDLMVLGLLDSHRCVPSAQQAVDWTRARLTGDSRDYLASLPATLTMEEIRLFHASPESVERRLSTVEDARRAFSLLNEEGTAWRIAFHGHTHKQRVFESHGNYVRLAHAGEGTLMLDPAARYIVSAGSVGQSRDPDPRTGYVLYDTQGGVEMVRLSYDWRTCQRKIRAAGLTAELFVPAPRLISQLTRWVREKLSAVAGRDK